MLRQFITLFPHNTRELHRLLVRFMSGARGGTTVCASFALLASVAHADEDPSLEYLRSGAVQTRDLVDILIGVAVTFALLAFFWGLAKLIFFAGDETEREKGKQVMIWGIIGLFFIFAVWGLVTLLQQLTGLGDAADDTPNTPRIPFEDPE